VALVGLGALVLAGQASAAVYHSPGYKGTKRFAKVVSAPFPAITIGTGKYPNLLVDEAGTAHIVFAQDGGTTVPDTLAYCNLQRGIKSCASAGTVPNPKAPEPSEGAEFSGNLPYLNHDFDGPVPLDIGNQLFVVERRFPEIFKTPAATTSDSNVFEWSSVDGGATITGPGEIGDNQMAGGAIAYGDPRAPSVGTISATETGGTFFQGSTGGAYTTAKAQLGTGDQAYYGSLALDGTQPVAAFADLSGNVFVREWSGQGNVNDASTWSSASFPGYQPHIVGGAGGVFVLYSDSAINGGNLQLRRIAGGQPSGAPVPLGKSTTQPAISEDPTGRIALAYTDQLGIEVRSSGNGSEFSAPALTTAIPSGQSIAHLESAATTDGGGFVSFVQNPVGGEGVGTVQVAAFGTQRATEKPGLGPLPGGGIGSAAGDQLATSTCLTAAFGVIAIENFAGGCWGHEPKNPNLDVSPGEVKINGLRIIPEAGVSIGIDPKLHRIDTTGNVRLVLSGGGVDVTIWRGELHAELNPGKELFDLPPVPTVIEGFPIQGDVDVKFVKGGVQVPISLKLPDFGVTGSATLEATTAHGLTLKSLEFKVDDANLGALELKDVDVSYTPGGEVWTGAGELQIPAGGGALDAKVSVEFDKGNFVSGSLDVGLPYPGIPLDDTDPVPQLYLTHGGLGLRLNPVTLSGTVGFGVTPLAAPGEGGEHDFAFGLDGQLSVAFGKPVTMTLKATGFLYKVELGQSTLTYKIPSQAELTGRAHLDLGIVEAEGQIGAIIDAKNRVFGALVESAVTLSLGIHDFHLHGPSFAINNYGFAIYEPPPGVCIPPIGPCAWGTVTYHWGDSLPDPHLYEDRFSGPYTAGIPRAGAAGARAHAAATGFTVPAHAPGVSIVVNGSGGAPSIVLVAPDGQRITPAESAVGTGETTQSLPDANTSTTYVGIQNPRSGSWGVEQAAGSPTPISGIEYSVGEPEPKIKAKLAGRAARRTLKYHAALPANVNVTLVEQAKGFSHAIGQVRGASGTIHFRPALGPIGRRQLVAQITEEKLPISTQTLGSFVVPRPPPPGRAKKLHVSAGSRALSFSFTPPANSAHTLLRIVATDGRRLQEIVPPRTRRGSVPVIGFHDGITVTVIGLAEDGSRGPAVKASARQKPPATRHPSRRPGKKHH
jgi:hypothetical protein